MLLTWAERKFIREIRAALKRHRWVQTQSEKRHHRQVEEIQLDYAANANYANHPVEWAEENVAAAPGDRDDALTAAGQRHERTVACSLTRLAAVTDGAWETFKKRQVMIDESKAR